MLLNTEEKALSIFGPPTRDAGNSFTVLSPKLKASCNSVAVAMPGSIEIPAARATLIEPRGQCCA